MPIPTTYTWPLIAPTPPTPTSGTSGVGLFVGTGLNQSAIREGGDQIFLDTADGNRLNAVTANLGLFRPIAGHSDDEWRAVAKQVALKAKLPRTMLERILEVCLGPQYSRISNLSARAVINDTVLAVNDASAFVQVGSVVLDKGTAVEETAHFGFADVVNNALYLTSPLRFTHNTLTNASSYLRANASVGATSLLLVDSSLFPITGFPYPVLLDQGSVNEEMILVTANNTGTNTLTCSVLAKAHLGPKSLFLKESLIVGTPAKRNFLTFGSGQTKGFPQTGFIRINKGTGTEEVLSYFENDIDNNVLMLDKLLAFSHSAGEPVDQVTSGCPVSTASVLQQGVYWDIFETAPREVQIYVPATVQTLRLIDASYLHAVVPAPFSTTLSSGTSPATTVLSLTSASGFPDEAGMAIIGGVQIVFYTLRDEIANQLTLDRPVGNTYPGGTSVALFTVAYGGTSLEDGNMRTLLGVRQFDHFSGPYVYDRREDGPGINFSTLSSLLPNITNVMASQKPTRTSLEVLDVSLWSGFPFNVIVGKDSGFEETVSVINSFLRKNVTPTTVNGAQLAGALVLNVGSTVTYPTSASSPAGYRLRINKGAVNEEFVRVNKVESGTQFSLESPMLFNHANTEPVDVVNDIIITSALSKDHAGQQFLPSKDGHTVEPLITQIPVVSGSSFDVEGGTVWLNFGKEKRDARSKIASVGSPTSYVLVDTSKFPTTNYPYQVFIGRGLFNEEKVLVTNNNTGTNTLTLQGPGTANTHVAEENVTFTSGDPETIDYAGVSGNNLILAAPLATNFKHLVGERVELSSGPSVPRIDGFGFDFKLPPDPAQCYTTMFDLVRAAGVEIITINKR